MLISCFLDLQECAESVLGNRATMFTASLSNPEGLVNYR